MVLENTPFYNWDHVSGLRPRKDSSPSCLSPLWKKGMDETWFGLFHFEQNSVVVAGQGVIGWNGEMSLKIRVPSSQRDSCVVLQMCHPKGSRSSWRRQRIMWVLQAVHLPIWRLCHTSGACCVDVVLEGQVETLKGHHQSSQNIGDGLVI